MFTLKGGCLCGNIRYELLTEPRATYACHCRFCQRDTGTAHRSGLSYLDESVIFSGDSPKTYTYRSEEHVVYAKHRIHADETPAIPI